MKIMFFSFCRLYSTILEFINRKNFEKIVLNNKDTVINLVNNLPFDFSQAIICKFLQITEHQYKIWKHNTIYKCSHSLIGYCSKRFPHQISGKEIKALQNLGAYPLFGDLR